MSIIAKIFGYILGDGWIDIKGNGGISGERDSLQVIAKDINYVFGPGSTGKIRTEHTVSPLYHIEGVTSQFAIKSNVTKKILNLGMPRGKRVEVPYQLPCWIIAGDKDLKTSFFSGYYAADGSIPSVQINRETPRPLSFCFYKNLSLEKNGDHLASQYQCILSDLGFTSTLTKSFKQTGGPRVVYTITLENQKDSFLRQLKMLDLSYCLYREEKRLQLITYLSMKEEALAKLRVLKDFIFQCRNEGKSYKEISVLTSLNENKIDHILSGHNKCNRLVGFPKFDENFIKEYCSPVKTPLNDETLFRDNDVPSLSSNAKVVSND